MSVITRRQAEAVLSAVKDHWSPVFWGSSPKLRDHTHEGLRPGSWSIDWQDGPEGWALKPIPSLDQDVFLEPVNAYTVGIYPPLVIQAPEGGW